MTKANPKKNKDKEKDKKEICQTIHGEDVLIKTCYSADEVWTTIARDLMPGEYNIADYAEGTYIEFIINLRETI